MPIGSKSDQEELKRRQQAYKDMQNKKTPKKSSFLEAVSEGFRNKNEHYRKNLKKNLGN